VVKTKKKIFKAFEWGFNVEKYILIFNHLKNLWIIRKRHQAFFGEFLSDYQVRG
jgi:hypothetical protein